MARPFWYHLALAFGLYAVACLLAGALASEGQALAKLYLPGLDAFPHIGLLTLALSPLLLYQIARAAVRLNRSDASASYLALHAAAISLPILLVVMPSARGLLAVTVAVAAMIDLLDARVSTKIALRAGLLLGFGALLDPGLLFAFAALFVPAMIIAGGRRARVGFVAGAAVPVLAAAAAARAFGWEGATVPWALGDPSLEAIAAVFRGDMTDWRLFSDTYLVAAYAPFVLAALAAVGLPGAGIDRVGTALAVWLGAAVGVAAVLGLVPPAALGLAWAVAFLMLVLSANTGFGVLLALGGESRGRMWTGMLAALFLLPAVLGWIHLAAER